MTLALVPAAGVAEATQTPATAAPPFVAAPPVSTPQRLPRALWKRVEAMIGRGVVAVFGTAEPPALARLPTGLDALDEALDGGLPRGRLVEISGPPASGKTRLALQVCSAVQRGGSVVAFVDADHGLDTPTVQRAGLDPARLVIARPDGGEAALHVVDELLRHRAADVIVVDSVASLVPRAELLGMTGAAAAGHHARLMSQAIRRLTMQAAKAKAVVIFVNQLRRAWGEDGKGYDVTTGGHALVYAAATRLALTGNVDEVRVVLKKARFGKEGRVVRSPWKHDAPSTTTSQASSSSSRA
jgi:recombination protein RecA